jgi:TP901-1 family phage major tail protein
MTAFVGRKAVLSMGSPLVAVAALRTKTMSLANEPVDVTSDDDNGFRKLLQDPGNKTLDISIEGVAKDVASFNSLMTLATSGTDILESVSLLFPAIGTIAGEFVISSFEIGAPYNEAATFSCTLQSAGAYTWTSIP